MKNKNYKKMMLNKYYRSSKFNLKFKNLKLLTVCKIYFFLLKSEQTLKSFDTPRDEIRA